MKHRKVKSIKRLRKPTLAHFDTPIDELVKIFLRTPASRNLFVLNEEEVLVGLIDRNRLFRTIHSHHLHPGTRISELYQLATAASAQEIMVTHVITATRDDVIEDVVKTMLSHNLFEIPVIDAEGHLIGILDSTYFLEEWVEKQA